ncbi:hypothetical protein F0562_034038 [Nyssa sinensis]|uniref:Uncharacterized protein n=1 Tax=Nyssa sinensis TaxID=561372 RepID=A0A5J5ADV8_9ASTE|nr:hypothetical protein F0562_034038 [Nyssa sinensis]
MGHTSGTWEPTQTDNRRPGRWAREENRSDGPDLDRSHDSHFPPFLPFSQNPRQTSASLLPSPSARLYYSISIELRSRESLSFVRCFLRSSERRPQTTIGVFYIHLNPVGCLHHISCGTGFTERGVKEVSV